MTLLGRIVTHFKVRREGRNQAVIPLEVSARGVALLHLSAQVGRGPKSCQAHSGPRLGQGQVLSVWLRFLAPAMTTAGRVG